MTQLLIDKATATDPPAQLDEFIAGITAGGSVTQVYDRGGRTAGQQVDAVVVVRDEQFADFVSVLDSLTVHTFGAILPGWHDRSVSPADGARSVHLVARGNTLLRWRLQVLPASAGAPVIERGRAVPVYRREPESPAGHRGVPVSADRVRPGPTTNDHVVEVLVRLHEALERTGEDSMLAAYAQLSLALDALKNVVWSMIGTPDADRGWDGLDEALAATVIGRRCLTALRDLTSAGMPAGVRELTDVIADILAVIELAAPDVALRMTGPLDSYRQYLGIWDRAR